MVTHLAGKPQTPTAQGSRQITQCNKAQDLYAIYRIDVRYCP